MIRIFNAILISSLLLCLSCGKKNVNEDKIFNTKPVSLKTVDFPKGADPNITADLGGNGFEGINWISKSGLNSVGCENAVKGGQINISQKYLPVSLRIYDKSTTYDINEILSDLLYESMLSQDNENNDFVPLLATHWKTENDKLTYSFRINPDARWADGMPVTTDDVVATLNLLRNENYVMPFLNDLYSSYEEPVVLSKYIFSIKSKQTGFLQFDKIALMKILPAHIIKNLTPDEYLNDYQKKYIPGSGPYAVLNNDFETDKFVKLTRRSDYWAEHDEINKGLYNFDVINFELIADESLSLEKFKAGEIHFNIPKFSVWKDSFNFDKVERGLIQKKKVLNKLPVGSRGLCFNTRVYPFNDIRVRKAFVYMFDVQKYIDKLFAGEFSRINSYFPDSEFENKSNPVLGFNPDSALALLKEAGWDLSNKDGKLYKEGKRLEIEIPFYKPLDRILSIYQEDLSKIGVILSLKETDFVALTTLAEEHKFTIIPFSWSGNTSLIPDAFFSSVFAESQLGGNWTGFKNSRIDELCKLYNASFNKNERVKLLSEIDSIASFQFASIFSYYDPSQKFLYHNLFGYPDCVFEKYNGFSSVYKLWFYDKAKISDYYSALNDNSKQLKIDNLVSKYWLNK
jgi:microcin C transport system substrate-binding protein